MKGQVDHTSVESRLKRLRRLAASRRPAADDPVFVNALLEARARRLAINRAQLDERPVGTAALCFRIANENYGLPLTDLAEVMPLAAWTPVPGVSQHLLGVTDVRGEIRPVLDLHAMLSLPSPDASAPGYALFLRGEGSEVGVRVDTLDRIRFVDHALLTLPHESANGLPQRFVFGITPDTLILLDTRQILALDLLQDRRSSYRADMKEDPQ